MPPKTTQAQLYGKHTKTGDIDKLKRQANGQLHRLRVRDRWLPLREIRVEVPISPPPEKPPWSRTQTFFVWYIYRGPGRLLTATASIDRRPERHPKIQLSLAKLRKALAGKLELLNCPQDYDSEWVDSRPVLRKGRTTLDPDLTSGYWYDKKSGIVKRVKVTNHKRTPSYDTYTIEEVADVVKVRKRKRRKE